MTCPRRCEPLRVALAVALAVFGCKDHKSVLSPDPSRAAETEPAPAPVVANAPGEGRPSRVASPTSEDAAAASARNDPAGDAAADAAREAGEAPASRSRPPSRVSVEFLPDRRAYVGLPSTQKKPWRLIAGIHGVCTPPSYSCGTWQGAAAEVGILVCPTGNAPCADSPALPTWEEPFAKIDDDLEVALAKVGAHYPGAWDRKGAILTGYSRGAYAAAIIAARHPGRWPLLILNEADVELSLPTLKAARIRAVALIAGEWGNQIAGERKNAEDLAAQGYPIRLWVMPKTGHPYSANIDDIMREAIAFVVSHEQDG